MNGNLLENLVFTDNLLDRFRSSFSDNQLHDLNGSKPIYECNSNCRCPPDCSQRVLQNGCTIPLKVEYISPQTGFGLFSTIDITEGSFIIEYIGELITKDEASLRVKKVCGHNKISYSNDIQKEENGEMNYILSVNENFTNDHEVGCIVDASQIGNGARFANHSCKPNAKLVPIHVENEYPRIGLFSTRQIESGEEITYNYGDEFSILGETKCQCKTRDCRGYLPKDSL